MFKEVHMCTLSFITDRMYTHMQTYVWTYESVISGRIHRKLVTGSRASGVEGELESGSIFTVCDFVFCILTVAS